MKCVDFTLFFQRHIVRRDNQETTWRCIHCRPYTNIYYLKIAFCIDHLIWDRSLIQRRQLLMNGNKVESYPRWLLYLCSDGSISCNTCYIHVWQGTLVIATSRGFPSRFDRITRIPRIVDIKSTRKTTILIVDRRHDVGNLALMMFWSLNVLSFSKQCDTSLQRAV